MLSEALAMDIEGIINREDVARHNIKMVKKIRHKF